MEHVRYLNCIERVRYLNCIERVRYFLLRSCKSESPATAFGILNELDMLGILNYLGIFVSEGHGMFGLSQKLLISAISKANALSF